MKNKLQSKVISLALSVAVVATALPAFSAGAAFETTPMIAAGGNHTIVLKNSGTVWAWGSNWCGKLGDGTSTFRSTPVRVTGISDVTAVSAGENHTIALKSNGTVWTWGNNEKGQLGDGTTTYYYLKRLCECRHHKPKSSVTD